MERNYNGKKSPKNKKEIAYARIYSKRKIKYDMRVKKYKLYSEPFHINRTVSSYQSGPPKYRYLEIGIHNALPDRLREGVSGKCDKIYVHSDVMYFPRQRTAMPKGNFHGPYSPKGKEWERPTRGSVSWVSTSSLGRSLRNCSRAITLS